MPISARRAASTLGMTPVSEEVPYDPRYSTRWHRHDYPSPIARWNAHPEYEIHLVTRGSGSYIVGDAIGRFEPGQLTLVGPGIPHDWISEIEPGEVIAGRDVVLQFNDMWIRDCIRRLPELAHLRVLLDHSRRGIEFQGDAAERGAELLLSIGEAGGTERLITIFRLLDLLAAAPAQEYNYLTESGVETDGDTRGDDAVGKALDHVHDNMGGDLRLGTIARLVRMSDSAFSRHFKRITGQAYSHTVRRMRLARACTLLEQTTEPVSSVAQTVGFGNLSNFNRQFLAEVGCSPLRYRALAKFLG